MKALATKVKHFLDQHKVAYRILNHERTSSLAKAVSILQINPLNVLKAVLLRDSKDYVLAVLPLNYQMDMNCLFQQLHRSFEVVPKNECDSFFQDCEPGVNTPFGEAYGISIILDKSIEQLNKVYLEVGCHTSLIQLSMHDFKFLTDGAPYLSFAFPEKSLGRNNQNNSHSLKNLEKEKRLVHKMNIKQNLLKIKWISRIYQRLTMAMG